MRTKGKIASWNDQKGYGFIDPHDGGRRIFVHIKAFKNRVRRPEKGQIVSYALSSDKQGRPCAVQATFAGEHLPQKAKSDGAGLIIGASIFLLSVAIAVVVAKAPLALFAAYLLVSLITFTVYAFDKSAAQNGRWRTPESTLHMLSLLGGWPGAIVAQQKLRHKSRKQPFRTVFWLTVAVNCVVFLWLMSPSGAANLQSFLGML